MKLPNTLIFFGAGATADLGLPPTENQDKFFRSLTGEGSIRDRLKDNTLSKDALDDFEMTLKLLYDGNGKRTDTEAFEIKEKTLKNFCNRAGEILGKSKLSARLKQYLHTYVFPYYDWLAFKSIYNDLIKTGEEVKLHHVLSVITKALLEDIAIPTKELFTDEKKQTLSVYINYRQRLEGSLRVYKLLIFKLFKHKIRKMNRKTLNLYEKFLKEIFNYSVDFDFMGKDRNLVISREGFVSPISYATLNWDPVIPFYLIKQAKLMNDKITSRGKRVYVSYGAPFSIFKMSGGEKIGYIIDEDAAFFTNLMSKEKKKVSLFIQLVKFFPAHGLMNLRTCPRCQNVFLIFPRDVGKLSPENLEDVFLLDPLPSDQDLRIIKERHFERYIISDTWHPSQINCPVCGSPTFFFDTFMQIQSILKSQESPVMRKVFYDYAEMTSKAEHMIFIGYSFPDDDIVHLLSLLVMKTGANHERKVTIILKNNHYNQIWYSLGRIINKVDEQTRKTLKNAELIAKKENIRVTFLGFPQILERTDVQDILNWRMN